MANDNVNSYSIKVEKRISKNTGKPYTRLYVDCKYRQINLCVNHSLIAEMLDICPSELEYRISGDGAVLVVGELRGQDSK